jgi:hypothetical protein
MEVGSQKSEAGGQRGSLLISDARPHIYGGAFSMRRVLFVSLFCIGLIVSAAVSWPQEDYIKQLPPGEGKELVLELCSNACHNLQKVVSSRKTDKEWERSVTEMISRGARILPEEIDQIVTYLAKSFPPNKAAN